MSQHQQAYIYALSAVLLWSTVATAFKIALEFLTPLYLLAIAVSVSAVFLLAVLIKQGKLSQALPHFQKQKKLYLLLAAINPTLYYIILFQAYDLLPAQQAQTINYTWAITLSLLSVPFLGHKLKLQDIIALIMAYAGALIIATEGDVLGLNFSNIPGVILAFASTLFWALYWIFNTRNQDDPVLSLFIGFTIALIPVWLIALVFSEPVTWGWQGLLAASYVGLFEMGVTFWLWQTALHKTEHTAGISSLIFLSPFLSLVFISQILGEAIHSATIWGLCLIIAGILIQKLKGKSKATH
ncbi:DMT family transporter [Bermanella marisrubri]|uniref:EamA domain-containing protein n=1 Tax=Bermanella marisrubri TaxID=207949 RepID=Q1N243_9GAMM|nr:DMT family transporter [Bermanella marisrubri]EAT12321.1 hypothetical protein RED65_15818 [Bermanella marisrubri]QIZ85409.1 DMT family transporter [Bermanella marisrubri]